MLDSNNYENHVFNLLPFRYCGDEGISGICEKLKKSAIWANNPVDSKYLLKYVTSNLSSAESTSGQMAHYVLKEGATTLKNVPHQAEVRHDSLRYPLTMEGIELYLFSSGVGIIVFGMSYEDNDPIRIAYAQYELKKAGRSKLYWATESGACERTLMELAKELLAGEFSCDLFFYANDNQERANVMSYVELPVTAREKQDQNLYFLRNCFGPDFQFDTEEEVAANQFHRASEYTFWGISRECIACIVYPDMAHNDFVRNSFRGNVQTQYLLMYVLLLHQKYTMYGFLTDIDGATYTDLSKLEEYQSNLYAFKAHFGYKIVTEVSQYQNLYNKIRSRMALDQLMLDVEEPLAALVLQQRRKEQQLNDEREKEEAARGGRMNRLLTLISFLAIISAIVDGFGLIDAWPGTPAKWIYCSLIILAVAITLISILLDTGEKKEK